MGVFWRVLSAIAATSVAGVCSLLLVRPSELTWFAAIQHPALVPPESTFALIWLFMYALMMISIVVIWTSHDTSSKRSAWVRFYFAQLVFGLVWLLLFFVLHETLIAFFEILFFAFIVLSLVVGAWDIDNRASYLLAPCFLCLLFIAFLNLNIWMIN